MFIVTAGCIEHLINGEVRKLKKGTFVLIRPKDVHRVGADVEGAEHININFSAEMFETILKYWDDEALNDEVFNSDFPPERYLDDEDCSYVAGKFLNTMFRENVSFAEQTYNMKKTVFDVFTKFFVRTASKTDENRGVPKWLSNTVNEMKKKENFSIGYSQMVKLSGVSTEHLSRSFLKHYKITPTKFINTLRVNYMSYMLAYSDLPIIDIWLDAGFQSAAYAYKLFKENFGVTPDKYRKDSMHLME